MNTSDFLIRLHQLGVKVSRHGDRLRVKASEAVLDAPLRQELAERKEEILSFLERAQSRPHAPIPRAPRGVPLPVSFAQRRLWFMEQLQGPSATYNTPAALRLRGRLSVPALRASLDAVVARHEVLRTTFTAPAGEPLQVVRDGVRVGLALVDVGHLGACEREAEVARLMGEEAGRAFDLGADLMVRGLLVREGEEEHVLLLTLHHIASDGWSLGVLVRELGAHYAGEVGGAGVGGVEELPVQYADFALWQRGQDNTAQLSYWKQHLGGRLPTLSLPTDYPRPAIQDYRGAVSKRLLSAELTAALKAVGQTEDATLFMLLLAAFNLLLSRYSGQEDIIVGVPIAGRRHTQLEGLIGLFLNNLPLRTDLSGEPSFRELLSRVRQVTLDAYANQDVPFEQLVEELQPDRTLSHHPIFDVMLNFINTPQAEFILPGLSITALEKDDPDSKLSLTLHAKEAGGGIQFALSYQRALFSAERVEVMLEQYLHLLTQIAADPDKAVADYSLVTPRTASLLPSPAAALAEPPCEVVTALFLNRAKTHPAHPAVRQGGETWTYGELAERADALARLLCARGLRKGDVVGVDGPRSFGFIVGLTGVLMGGGVFLTLDPNYPQERHRVMLREGRAKFLLNLWGEPDKWPEASFEVIALDARTGRVDGAEAEADTALPVLAPEDGAYIFFTSGTTGVPKAVLGWHKGLSHFLHWQRQTFAITPADRVSHLAGLSFDGMLKDVFFALTGGATLCLPTEAQAQEPVALLSWLDRQEITILNTVPSRAQSWLYHVPPDVSLRHVRWLTFAGEPLHESLIRRWREAFPESGPIVNCYGATEITLFNCSYRVPHPPAPGVQPAGWPRPETQALVLKGGRCCGVGELGEIVLRSPFRTLGYLNAPHENEKRFVRNPYRDDEEDLLYYTGDEGRFGPDGALEVLGRLDEQVKIRGVRVELGEIKSVLGKHPALAACEVVARPGEHGNYLIAYVVFKPGQRPEVGSLRSYLAQQLPEPMTPGFFVPLTALPLTPNGKVDRRALPEPEPIQPQAQVAPRTPTEETLAQMWAEVLGLERLGVCDNFFESGGHSLLATQLMSRVRQTFQVELPIRTLFEEPTVEGLAKQIDVIHQTQAMQVSRAGERTPENRRRGRL